MKRMRLPVRWHSPFVSVVMTWRLCVQVLCVLAIFGLVETNLFAQCNNFWRTQSIYQIITDRFYDGNPSNNNAEGTYAPSNPTGVHGGDFDGIEKKLDYIKALGATAIWISPIVLNTEGQFHGYSAWNFYQVAPHWGSISDLQNLVQAAHARGLLVIDDIVVNHAGDLVRSSGGTFNYPAGYALSYRNNSKTYPAPFTLTATNPSLTNLFHNYGNIADYNNSTQALLDRKSTRLNSSPPCNLVCRLLLEKQRQGLRLGVPRRPHRQEPARCGGLQRGQVYRLPLFFF